MIVLSDWHKISLYKKNGLVYKNNRSDEKKNGSDFDPNRSFFAAVCCGGSPDRATIGEQII